jgi:7-cyano-7-deazaguanine reductase
MPIYGSEENPIVPDDPGPKFQQLQDRGQNEFKGLERFELPGSVVGVNYDSDEFTALCPITGQPDWYQVEIILGGSRWGIESKSLKLYLGTFRQVGAFCEALADKILTDVLDLFAPDNPMQAQVRVTQKRRGGISIDAVAVYDHG